MPQIFVDRTVKSLKCGDNQHDYSARSDNASHSGQGRSIVFNMLKDVETYARIAFESFQISKLRIVYIAAKGVDILLTRMSFFQAFDTIRFHVESDNLIAVEKH
jgi:hypothetical protein